MSSKLLPLFVAIADVHRTNSRPVCRKEENIMDTQDAKLKTVVLKARELGVPLLCAGDLFDTWKCGYDVFNSTAAALKGVPFIGVYGQHELPNHDMSEFYRSPLTHLIENSQDLFSSSGKYVRVTRVNWGEKIPTLRPIKYHKNTLHVLLMHRMVYLGNKPFPNAKGNVRKLIKKPKFAQFDIIITGDNHISFMYTTQKTLWANCGCLYRTDAKEIDYIPTAKIFYVDGNTGHICVKDFFIPFKKEDVSEEHLEVTRLVKEWDSSFVKEMESMKDNRPISFEEKLRTLGNRRLSKSERKKLWECVEGALPF